MQNLEDFLDGIILTEQAILERVEEYALYCYYLGFAPEIGRPIHSPIRKPDDPDTIGSFSIFIPTRTKGFYEYLWADNATGQRGNVFGMIALMHGGISRLQTLELIDKDFEIGFGTGNPSYERIMAPSRPKIYEECSIKVRSRPWNEQGLNYWAKYGVDRKVLDDYFINQLDMYWLHEAQRHPKVVGVRELAFSYRVWSKHKIYKPFADKKDKFRNDFTPKHIEGFCQLKFNRPYLIITKANKDNAMFRSIGDLDTVAAHSENTPLPEEALRFFERKYPAGIFVWFDNDGKESSEKFYPESYIKIHNPPDAPKDPSDYRDVCGEEKTARLITQLTGIEL